MTVTRLELQDASRILRDALKDKSYRSTPLGLEAARYIRWFRSEYGATESSIRDYEAILARLALFFSDLELSDFEPPVGKERLRECWDHHWGDKSGRTRKKVRSVWVSFFDWAIREGRGIHGNPARMLTSPKARGVKREPYSEDFVTKTIVHADYLPDRLGLRLVLKYALRRAEIAGVRIRDFDFERRTVTVSGKGGKVRSVTIQSASFWRDLGDVEMQWGGREQCLDFFIVHQRERRGMKTFYWPHRGYVPRSVHKWWYDRLEDAGVVGADRVGLGMHRGRHTVASNIIRKTGSMRAAQDVLGHAEIGTTMEFYADWNIADTAAVMAQLEDEDDRI